MQEALGESEIINEKFTRLCQDKVEEIAIAMQFTEDELDQGNNITAYCKRLMEDPKKLAERIQ